MPRIPQNSHERAIGMLNAGMAMNAVALNIGCSTLAIQHPRQRFQDGFGGGGFCLFLGGYCT